MRNVLFLLVIFVSCKSDKDLGDQESLDWMLGNWQRVNEEAGKKTYEIWVKKGNTYEALGFTMIGKDTVFKELMILEKADFWNLEVAGVNSDTVKFRAKEFKKDQLSVYNPDHDFPTEIHYWMDNDTLKAQVGNLDERINFQFVKN